MNFDLNGFIQQSSRVLNITHKPKQEEFRRMALVTALGIAVVGVIGFAISTISALLR
ncbi:MAG: protein translocase SEC61 complex subunit gamma [Candidatus Marsarchaeota archaeon]|nr:protein translocase SEC61 complex subunit gamma [Candidatus Marsarchaeota archaeon]